MGKVFGSCGHEIDREWMDDPRCNVIRPRLSRECGPALSYSTECRVCAVEGERFRDVAHAERWLNSRRPEIVVSPC